jgi:hypothetical protein
MKNPYLPSDPTEIEVHTNLLRFKHRSPKLAHFWGILLRHVEILHLGTDSGMNYSPTTLSKLLRDRFLPMQIASRSNLLSNAKQIIFSNAKQIASREKNEKTAPIPLG